MPHKKKTPVAASVSAEGLDREIAILRDLIRQAAAKQKRSSSSCSTRSARPLPRWRAC